MIDFSFILINAEEKAGGLFDFDGTLPLTIFQFLVLMFLLERFLYKPFSEIGDIRSENLRDKADKAESTLTTANQLAKLYENEEGKTRFTFIAVENDVAVGYITGIFHDGEYDAQLHQIYVLPTAIGHGIGKQLVTT